MRRTDELLGRMLALFARMEDGEDQHARTAFVTFERQEGVLRCLETFRHAGPSVAWPWWCGGQAVELRMEVPRDHRDASTGSPGRPAPLEFKQAPNPGTILWENLNLSPLNRLGRRLFTLLVVVVCLGFSAAIISVAKTQDQDMKRQFPPTVCPAERITEARLRSDFAAMQNCDNPAALACFCEQLFAKTPTDIYEARLNLTGVVTDGSVAGLPVGHAAYGWQHPLNVSGTCVDRYSRVGMQPLACREWASTKIRTAMLTFASVLVVLAVNGLLSVLMAYLAKVERHENVTNQNLSKARKFFVAQLMNTCLVVLVVNCNLRLFTEQPFDLISGSHKDMDSGWYMTVGASILLTMTLNIVTPNLMPLAKVLVHKAKLLLDRGCCRWCDPSVSHKLTQHDYERMLMGPEWPIFERYGQMLNVIFMTLIFSSCMPLLNLLAAVNFVVVYWVDKYVFLRLYRTPPPMDEYLAMAVSGWLLPSSAVAHLMFAAWSFSNPEVLRHTGGGLAAHHLQSMQAAYSEATAGGGAGSATSIPQLLVQVLLVDRFSDCSWAVYFSVALLLLIVFAALARWLVVQHVVACARWLRACCCGAEGQQEEHRLNYTEALPLAHLQHMVQQHGDGSTAFSLSERRLQKVRLAIEHRLSQGAGEGAETPLMNPNTPVDYNMSSNAFYSDFMESGDMTALRACVNAAAGETRAWLQRNSSHKWSATTATPLAEAPADAQSL
jgi:hypothetical protein